MGYHTVFDGFFEITPKISEEHRNFINQFNDTRRMQRNSDSADTLSDPIREAVGLPIGEEGGYFVGGSGFQGQGQDDSVTNFNNPPIGQPGLWCQWCIDLDNELCWDGDEKFENYIQWLAYLMNHFLIPWGYNLNGEVNWEGEDNTDFGIMILENNQLSVREGVISYASPEIVALHPVIENSANMSLENKIREKLCDSM